MCHLIQQTILMMPLTISKKTIYCLSFQQVAIPLTFAKSPIEMQNTFSNSQSKCQISQAFFDKVITLPTLSGDWEYDSISPIMFDIFTELLVTHYAKTNEKLTQQPKAPDC